MARQPFWIIGSWAVRGTGVLSYFELFVELYAFPDLTEEEAAVDENHLRVKAKEATLGVETEIKLRKCMFCKYFVEMIMIFWRHRF